MKIVKIFYHMWLDWGKVFIRILYLNFGIIKFWNKSNGNCRLKKINQTIPGTIPGFSWLKMWFWGVIIHLHMMGLQRLLATFIENNSVISLLFGRSRRDPAEMQQSCAKETQVCDPWFTCLFREGICLYRFSVIMVVLIHFFWSWHFMSQQKG